MAKMRSVVLPVVLLSQSWAQYYLLVRKGDLEIAFLLKAHNMGQVALVVDHVRKELQLPERFFPGALSQQAKKYLGSRKNPLDPVKLLPSNSAAMLEKAKEATGQAVIWVVSKDEYEASNKEKLRGSSAGRDAAASPAAAAGVVPAGSGVGNKRKALPQPKSGVPLEELRGSSASGAAAASPAADAGVVPAGPSQKQARVDSSAAGVAAAGTAAQEAATVVAAARAAAQEAAAGVVREVLPARSVTEPHATMVAAATASRRKSKPRAAALQG